MSWSIKHGCIDRVVPLCMLHTFQLLTSIPNCRNGELNHDSPDTPAPPEVPTSYPILLSSDSALGQLAKSVVDEPDAVPQIAENYCSSGRSIH